MQIILFPLSTPHHLTLLRYSSIQGFVKDPVSLITIGIHQNVEIESHSHIVPTVSSLPYTELNFNLLVKWLINLEVDLWFNFVIIKQIIIIIVGFIITRLIIITFFAMLSISSFVITKSIIIASSNHIIMLVDRLMIYSKKILFKSNFIIDSTIIFDFILFTV